MKNKSQSVSATDRKEIEKRIREYFERNYELMRMESGQVLTGDLRQEALNQVLFYYQKMTNVAEHVTRTEVRLALPEQRTPKQRRFTIEGVVDVVQEGEETWLYDIKTHDPDAVRQHPERYKEQLNIYAHIWQTLQRQPLHHTAIIATQYPRAMKDAWRRNDMGAFLYEFERWDPLIELPFDKTQLQTTVEAFGEVVDQIEEKVFAPPTPARLGEGKRPFANRVCRNCDARFSCSSYRTHMSGRSPSQRSDAAKYFHDPAPDSQQNDWVDGNLSTTAELQ